MRKRCFALCMAALLLTACSEEQTADPGGESAVSPESAGNTANEETTLPAGETEESVEVVVEPYADIRYFEDDPGSKEVYEAGTFREEDIYTFTFNEGTVLEGSEELQAQIMEEGKNPGLGVRALHEQGITGEGSGWPSSTRTCCWTTRNSPERSRTITTRAVTSPRTAAPCTPRG